MNCLELWVLWRFVELILILFPISYTFLKYRINGDYARSTRYTIYRRALLACLYAKINLVWNRWLFVLWFLQLYIRPSQVTIRLHETSEADMAHKFWSTNLTTNARRRLSNGLSLPYEDKSQNSTASGLTQIFRVPVKLFDFRPLAASWNGRCRVLPVATIVNCQRNHSIGPFVVRSDSTSASLAIFILAATISPYFPWIFAPYCCRGYMIPIYELLRISLDKRRTCSLRRT